MILLFYMPVYMLRPLSVNIVFSDRENKHILSSQLFSKLKTKITKEKINANEREEIKLF